MSSKFGARRLTFTKLSQVVGSSQFISPEELLGKRADARSDIYSIGVMLYEMVTGQLPFPGPRMDERLTSYPVPPRELDPGISPQLQEVMYRAMEREPKNRYATAREFARDLTHLDEVGVTDRPELREWRKKPASPSEKFLLYAAIALIPIAIFGLMLLFRQALETIYVEELIRVLSFTRGRVSLRPPSWRDPRGSSSRGVFAEARRSFAHAAAF